MGMGAFCISAILLIALVRLFIWWLTNMGGSGGNIPTAGYDQDYCANPACVTGACTDEQGEVICEAYDA